MSPVIIDTNVFSDAMKADQNPSAKTPKRYIEAKNFLDQARASGKDVYVSETTVQEITDGFERRTSSTPEQRAEEKRQLSALSEYKSLSYDSKILAEIENDLRSRGQVIGENDPKIAATAKTHNLPLVTDNQKDFQRIKGLPDILGYGTSNDWKASAGNNINDDRELAENSGARFNDGIYDSRISKGIKGTGIDNENGILKGDGAWYKMANQTEIQKAGTTTFREDIKERRDADKQAAIERDKKPSAEQNNALEPSTSGTKGYSDKELGIAGTSRQKERVGEPTKDQPQSMEDRKARDSVQHWGPKKVENKPEHRDANENFKGAEWDEKKPPSAKPGDSTKSPSPTGGGGSVPSKSGNPNPTAKASPEKLNEQKAAPAKASGDASPNQSKQPAGDSPKSQKSAIDGSGAPKSPTTVKGAGMSGASPSAHNTTKTDVQKPVQVKGNQQEQKLPDKKTQTQAIKTPDNSNKKTPEPAANKKQVTGSPEVKSPDAPKNTQKTPKAATEKKADVNSQKQTNSQQNKNQSPKSPKVVEGNKSGKIAANQQSPPAKKQPAAQQKQPNKTAGKKPEVKSNKVPKRAPQKTKPSSKPAPKSTSKPKPKPKPKPVVKK